MHRNLESSGGGGDDLVVAELVVLDVDKVSRPDRPVDATGSTASTVLGIGDEGGGVAPPQQAINVPSRGLAVALYLRLVVDVGASHHNLSLAGDQEADMEPCSDGL